MVHSTDVVKGFQQRYPHQVVTVDSHTQGEPTRLVIGGFGELSGTSMEQRRRQFMQHHDDLRLLLTREPRGHRDMFAAVLTPPASDEGSFGLIYMDAQRYPYLCGHATIGAVTTLIETGCLPAVEGDSTIVVDTPSGPLRALVRVQRSRVESVALEMVPSFVFSTGELLDIKGFGTVTADLVCVGGFFAMVPAAVHGISLEWENSQQLISLGMAVIEAANRELQVSHPERDEVSTIDVAEFYAEDPATGNGISAVIYGKSHMDRSPCGTGTTAKMTLMHHKGQLRRETPYVSQSPLGTTFEGTIVRELDVGSFPGVQVQIRGSASITGSHAFVVDQTDPFPRGFLL